jgi:hypothetical protein
MHCFLFKFTVVLNSVLPLWKLLVFKSLLGFSETSVCSISALPLKIVLLLDAHQLLKSCAEISIYLKQKLFLSDIFYSNYGTSISLDTKSIQYRFTYISFPFSPPIPIKLWLVSLQLLLSSKWYKLSWFSICLFICLFMCIVSTFSSLF